MLSPFTSRITPLALLLVIVVPASGSAQAVADFERKLLPFRFGELKAEPESFWEALTFLREEEDRQRSLKADITFGMSGDESGERSLFKLATGISLSRGAYPSELSVVSRLFLQLRDGALQEDVTSLALTYDYHPGRHVEYFAFAERFTDSFLSIQQRYEVGFGARIGVAIGRSGDWRKTDAQLAAVDAGLGAIQQARISGLADPDADQWEAFRKARRHVAHAIHDRQTRLFLGVTAGVFSEIESAEMEVTTRPADGSGEAGAPIKIGLGSQQRYRLSVRPTLRLRPRADVLMTLYPYFKLPLDGPRHATLPDGSRRLDYRRDVLSELSWTIRKEQTGLENVQFVFTFNHFFDNVPPSLPQSLIDNLLATGRVFDRTSAEGSHSVVALVLRLGW